MKRNPVSMLRMVLWFLIILTLAQGCVVYTRPVASEKSFNKGPVKVYTTDGKIYKFNSLNQAGENLNGVKKVRGALIILSIPGNEIVQVKLKKIFLSDLLTAAAIAGGTTAVAGLCILGLSELYHQDK